MATLNDLQLLADELSEVAPPPTKPQGLNFVVPNSGKWKVQRTGAGMYAIRAEYQVNEHETRIVKMENEMTGYPTALMSALKFAVMIANASTYYWSAI